MSHCDVPGCHGHLAKFDNCVDEALYVLSLDQSTIEGWTGDVEWERHVSLIVVGDDEGDQWPVEISDELTVVVPWGSYLVLADDLGFVWTERYESQAAARIVFDEWDRAYSRWCDTEDAS